VCPCVILVHSQAGQFGYKVAQARPEKGNSHMIMMDKNSDEVAAYIQAWLQRQGLFE
jgi:hypothetical protein